MAEKKGAGGKNQTYDASTGRYGSNSSNKKESENRKISTAIQTYSDDPARDITEYGGLGNALGSAGRADRKIGTAELSKSEWKRYYDTLGEIKAGTVQLRKSKGNNRWVILNSNIEHDGKRTPARLILDNGSYESPKVKTVFTFNTDDELYDFINRIRNLS